MQLSLQVHFSSIQLRQLFCLTLVGCILSSQGVSTYNCCHCRVVRPISVRYTSGQGVCRCVTLGGSWFSSSKSGRVWDQCITWYCTYHSGPVLNGTACDLGAQDRAVAGITRASIHPLSVSLFGSSTLSQEVAWEHEVVHQIPNTQPVTVRNSYPLLQIDIH